MADHEEYGETQEGDVCGSLYHFYVVRTSEEGP